MLKKQIQFVTEEALGGGGSGAGGSSWLLRVEVIRIQMTYKVRLHKIPDILEPLADESLKRK